MSPFKKISFFRLLFWLFLTALVLRLSFVWVSSPSVQEGLFSEREPLRFEDLLSRQGGLFQEVPEYQMKTFSYYSVEKGEKKWKMQAQKANLFHAHQKLFAEDVSLLLYHSEKSAPTLLKSKKATHHLTERRLEFFNQVQVLFPDGFVLKSDYLEYFSDLKKIRIPSQHGVEGWGSPDEKQKFHFKSNGLEYPLLEQQIYLLKAVQTKLIQPSSKPNVLEETQIESDFCRLDRVHQWAYFEPLPQAPLSYVYIRQPGMIVRSRKARLHYGNHSLSFRSLISEEDVWIQELPQVGGLPSYSATAGKAEFDIEKDRLILTQFPQAYEGQDTMTGDVILLYRQTHRIEVERSNSFSFGEKRHEKKNTQSSPTR